MNTDLFKNTNEIAQEDFDALVKSEGLEVFTAEQYGSYFKSMESLLEKSDFDDLNDLEKGQFDLFKSDIESLDKWIVNGWNDETASIKKSVVFTREKQIQWDRGEDNELLKGISGTYLDTSLNRKMKRVGDKFTATQKDSE